MTLITGTIKNVGMMPVSGFLDAQPAEFRADGGIVYSSDILQYEIQDGVISAAVVPGPVSLTIRTSRGQRKTFDVVVPDRAEISLDELLDSAFPWEPPQIAEFTRLRDETVEAAQLAQDLLDGYVGGGEGTTNAALINGVFTDRVDVSQARVTTDATDRSVSELADEVDTKADQHHGHPMASVGGLSDALDGKADAAHTHAFGDLQGVPDRFPVEQHTHAKSEVDGLDAALAAKADLDGAGRLPASQLPALAIVEFLGEVPDEAGMLTLVGERGDWCVRQDTGTQWVVVAEPSSSAGSWREMVAPPSPVQSVAGRIGAVVLSKADVGLGSVDNTSDADKPISAATDAALALKSDTTHTHTAAQVGAIASDGTIAKVVRITQAAYDALPERDPATMYVIGGA